MIVTTITLRVETPKPLPPEFANRCAARLSSMHAIEGGSIEAVEPELLQFGEFTTECDDFNFTSAWQPIETAPKDGTDFLGYRDGDIGICYRVLRDDCEMWCFGGKSAAVEYFPKFRPTHWMPLPSSPLTKE